MIDVGEHFRHFGLEFLLRCAKGRHDFFPGSLLPLFLLGLVPKALGDEVSCEPCDGVVLLVPITDLVNRPIGRAKKGVICKNFTMTTKGRCVGIPVVRSGMVPDPISHCLDQDGPILAEADVLGSLFE